MISILSESENNILGVQATGKLTDSDYAEVWIPKLEQIINKHGKARALLYMDAQFEGWEASALWDDAKFGLKHTDDFEKIAIVGGPQWVKWSIKLVIPFMKCEVKSFRASQLDTAWRWIRMATSEDVA